MHGLARSAQYDDAVPTEPVRNRLAALRFVGELTAADAVSHGCQLIVMSHGADHAPDHIKLSLLVDQGGLVFSGRFQTNAKDDLLAAYDVMVELTVGHPLIDAKTVTPKRVEAVLRGNGTTPAFALTLVADQPFFILRKAVEHFEKPKDAPRTADQLPWPEVGLFEKVRRIETVLDQHVRPALASDGGGLDLVDLQGDELMVQYHGACGSCSSSIGGTLTFIQDSINNNLGTNLVIKVSQMSLEDAPNFGV